MNTGKIIKITEDTIFIGYEDGSIKEIKRSSVEFEPSVGDIVEIYGDIVIKAGNSKKLKLPKHFNISMPDFKKSPMPIRINLIVLMISLIITLIGPLFLRLETYLLNLFAFMLIFSLLLVILNAILLIAYSKTYKKIILRYLIAYIAIFVFSLLAGGITSSMGYKIDSVNNLKTADQFLKARGIPTKGYGEVSSEPKEKNGLITFKISHLEGFTFNNDKNNVFNQEHTNYVTATVTLPKSIYKKRIYEGDVILVEGKTSQEQEEGIWVESYQIDNSKQLTSDSDDNSFSSESYSYSYSSTNSSSEYSSSSSSSTSTEEVDTDKSHYGDVDYDQWNHDEVEKKTKVRISGKVLQEQDSEGLHTLRVAMDNDYDKIVYVAIMDSHYERTIAEDDQITLYGLALGRESYTTVLGASKTLPFMVAYMYEN